MPEKILVVEDDRTLLETLEYNLARQEYTVYKAMDGLSALRIARRELPDLIVLDRREVLLGGEPLRLKPQEYELLVFLVRNRGMALSRDLILERVWGWDFDGGTRTVDVHVRWLREKIERDPSHPTRIVTVRGVGYRFEG